MFSLYIYLEIKNEIKLWDCKYYFPRGLSEYQDVVLRNRNSHYKDKMFSQLFFFYNGNPYTSKQSLYIKTEPCRLLLRPTTAWQWKRWHKITRLNRNVCNFSNGQIGLYQGNWQNCGNSIALALALPKSSANRLTNYIETPLLAMATALASRARGEFGSWCQLARHKYWRVRERNTSEG